jgi:hypothetical protein
MSHPLLLQRICWAAALAACVLLPHFTAQAVSTSPLYLSTGSQIAVLEGSSVVNSWVTGDQEILDRGRCDSADLVTGQPFPEPAWSRIPA